MPIVCRNLLRSTNLRNRSINQIRLGQIVTSHFNKRSIATTSPLQKEPLKMGSKSTDPPPVNDPSPPAKDSPLPKLTPSELKTYNHMAEHMNLFHENFRRTYTLLLQSSKSNSRPQGMSVRQFLHVAEEFCSHLTLHHTIEERHIFPVLAKKMPAFRKELELLTQHKLIHEGIERLETYVRECKTGERELRLREVGEILEGFGEVLWRHLDEEVEELRGENMRKYWTLEEMRRMPM